MIGLLDIFGKDADGSIENIYSAFPQKEFKHIDIHLWLNVYPAMDAQTCGNKLK